MDRLSRLCMEAIAAGGPQAAVGPLMFAARTRLHQEDEARKRRLAKSGPRRQREAAKDAKMEAASVAIWRAILKRAGEFCELCGKPAYLMQAHHLLGGNGRRRQQEAVENVMAVHPLCHEAFHRRPWDYRHVVRAWAARHGYGVPNRKEFR